MKKRSMLALATLATGFVVAAITPSPAADDGSLSDIKVSDTLGSADQLVSHDSFAIDDGPLGQE
ncbi:hypothetical protein ACGFT2_01480 [Streptomyces sp. NPDC048514]|uniref:hypothetical protein n=1 Tax=Streptomyces sp. NPDC048514 TaxID=3365564 RepID=UPI003716B279